MISTIHIQGQGDTPALGTAPAEGTDWLGVLHLLSVHTCRVPCWITHLLEMQTSRAAFDDTELPHTHYGVDPRSDNHCGRWTHGTQTMAPVSQILEGHQDLCRRDRRWSRASRAQETRTERWGHW